MSTLVPDENPPTFDNKWHIGHIGFAFAFLVLLTLVIVMFFTPNPDFLQEKEATRICQASYGKPVCNDYNGFLSPELNGCTRISIVDNPDSEICGTYTLEHLNKK